MARNFQLETEFQPTGDQPQAIDALVSGELHETAQIEQDFDIDSSLSRANVRAATLKAIESGQVEQLNAQAFKFS